MAERGGISDGRQQPRKYDALLVGLGLLDGRYKAAKAMGEVARRSTAGSFGSLEGFVGNSLSFDRLEEIYVRRRLVAERPNQLNQRRECNLALEKSPCREETMVVAADTARNNRPLSGPIMRP